MSRATDGGWSAVHNVRGPKTGYGKKAKNVYTSARVNRETPKKKARIGKGRSATSRQTTQPEQKTTKTKGGGQASRSTNRRASAVHLSPWPCPGGPQTWGKGCRRRRDRQKPWGSRWPRKRRPFSSARIRPVGSCSYCQSNVVHKN